MRHSAPIVLAVLSICGSARAGLYFPGEPPDLMLVDGSAQPMPYTVFQLMLRNVLDIATPNSEPNRRSTLQRQQLEAKLRGEPSVEDLISLSGCYVRLRLPEKAFDTLRQAQRRDPRNFFVQSDIALVRHVLGMPDALSLQKDLTRFQPKDLAGLPPEQAAWYLRVEKVLYDVEKLRLKERKAAENSKASIEIWDDLFQVPFSGAGGGYEGGRIADEQKAKLPADAVAVVQQLLLWLPDDARLYWLLAELYNAAGNLEAASMIFDECINSRRFQPELLRDHRRIVKEAITAKAAEPAAASTSWLDHPEVFWVAGAVAVTLLAFLLYWQIREIVRRARGSPPTRR